jgi:hypothetical protein
MPSLPFIRVSHNISLATAELPEVTIEDRNLLREVTVRE